VSFRVFRGSELVFSLVGVTPAYRRLGLPAMPGKQKHVTDKPQHA